MAGYLREICSAPIFNIVSFRVDSACSARLPIWHRSPKAWSRYSVLRTENLTLCKVLKVEWCTPYSVSQSVISSDTSVTGATARYPIAYRLAHIHAQKKHKPPINLLICVSTMKDLRHTGSQTGLGGHQIHFTCPAIRDLVLEDHKLYIYCSPVHD